MALNDLEANLELKSHADTSCRREGALVLTYYESPVHIKGYEPDLVTNTYFTIRGAFVYDHPYTGQTYHIVIHQAVEIPDLKHYLLCPMQVRTNIVTVNKYPRLLTEHPTEETHAFMVTKNYIFSLNWRCYGLG